MGRGRLEIFTGPMFAGKSAHLIKAAHRRGLRILVLKPAFDTRDGTHVIASRSNISCDARPTATWPSDVATFDAVIVDEVQFMTEPYYQGDVVCDIKATIDAGIEVIVGGLDTDYRREPFSIVSALVGLADDHTHLQARCHGCGAPADWTAKRAETGARLELGDDDLYEARCGDHWTPPG